MLVKVSCLSTVQVSFAYNFTSATTIKQRIWNIIASTLYSDTSEPVHGKNTYFFGKFNEAAVYFSYSEFPIFIVFGVFGGLVGALFVNVNYRLSVLRMKLVFVVTYYVTLDGLCVWVLQI